MTVRPIPLLSGLVAAAMLVLAITTSHSAAQSDVCSRAAAVQATEAAGALTDNGLADPVGAVTCGSFLGPGSQAMAVTIAHGVCWPNLGWMAFSLTAGTWQRVPAAAETSRVRSLAVVDDDLRETVPLWREKDSFCLPTGGSATRNWHWDGTRLRPGPLTFVKLPDASSRVDFVSADRRVACEIGDHSGRIFLAFCRSEKRQLSATVDLRGRYYPCRGSARSPCIGHPPADAPSLPLGQSLKAGRFRCSSLSTGIRCVVTRTGKGFLISANRIRRVA